MQALNLVNMRFGSWVVVARAGSDSRGKSTWLCRCDCGTEAVVNGVNLKRGGSKSCGCQKYIGFYAEHERRTKYRTIEDYLANCTRNGDCLEWNGYIAPDGYAHSGRHLSRAIFEKLHGYKPPVVMHTCDNPKCINPDHLRGGTHKDNTQDMINKGRHPRLKPKSTENTK